MCLVPRSDDFECQCQKSKVKVTRDKKTHLALTSPLVAYEWYALAANNVRQQRTAPFRPCQGVISGACVRCMFGKTSLALVFFFLNFGRTPHIRLVCGFVVQQTVEFS